MSFRRDAGAVARWLSELGLLCATGAMSADEVARKMALYAKHLTAEGFEAGCFNARSLRFVADRCKHFPTYGELAEALREWRKENRLLDGSIYTPAERPALPPQDARPAPEREDTDERWWMGRIAVFEAARDVRALRGMLWTLTRRPGTYGERDPGTVPRERVLAALRSTLARLDPEGDPDEAIPPRAHAPKPPPADTARPIARHLPRDVLDAAYRAAGRQGPSVPPRRV